VPDREPGGRLRFRAGTVAVALVLVGVLLVGSAAPARGAPYPPLPLALDRDFVGNLSAPTLAPGSSGSIALSVSNPLAGTIDAVNLTLDVYAFNGFPGNDTSAAPVAGAPVLTTAASSGPYANLSAGALAPGQRYQASVGVATSASTPAGAFAVRIALSFVLASNGTTYRLESRGWFSNALWQSATELPNGSTTLNLSVLGVSGVVPETTVYVATSSWDWVLGGLLAAGILLVGLGAWVYFRRGPGSTSGTR
jgi:hypothetical protein